MNIKLNYLYRDNSNYKKFGSVVFVNSGTILLEEFKEKFTRNLIDGEYFLAEELGLPTLFFDELNEDDHQWHEFENIEATIDCPNLEITIEEFLIKLEHEKSKTPQ